jgi:hypothetical protein
MFHFGRTTCFTFGHASVFHFWEYNVCFNFGHTTRVSVLGIQRAFQFWAYDVCFNFGHKTGLSFGHTTRVSVFCTVFVRNIFFHKACSNHVYCLSLLTAFNHNWTMSTDFNSIPRV